MINPKTMAELEHLYESAQIAAEHFNKAAKEQAEKGGMDPQGLKRVVRARVNDKLEKLRAEQDTVGQLILQFSLVDDPNVSISVGPAEKVAQH